MKKEWIIGIFALIVVIVAVFYFSKGTNLEPGKMPIGDYNINIENFAYVP